MVGAERGSCVCSILENNDEFLRQRSISIFFLPVEMPVLDGQQVAVAGLTGTEKKAVLAQLQKLGASAALLINKKVELFFLMKTR